MVSKDTGFHPSDPDWTRGRTIAISDADALARRQISMRREVAMRELARLGQAYDAPEPTPAQIDLLCLSVQDVINGRLETGAAAADLAAVKEHLDTALKLTGFDGSGE